RAVQAPDDLRRAQHLEDAVERYGGRLLPGFYEEWVLAEQDRLSERFLQAARQLVSLLEKSGARARAREWARRVVSQEPLREEGHAEVMRLLAADDQHPAALRQYRELERLLDQELGEAPGPALRRFARQIEDQLAAGGPADGGTG